MPVKYKSYKKEILPIRILKGIGYGLISEFMCGILVISMIAMGSMWGGSAIIKVIFGLFTLTVTLGLYFNWSHNAAKLDRDGVSYHNAEFDKYMPVKMAVGGPIVSIVTYILLILSKVGVIRDFFNIFLAANFFSLPFVDCFTSERTVDCLSVWGILGLGLLVISQCAVVVITYYVTYKDIDVLKYMYKD